MNNINEAIKQHEISEKDWDMQEDAFELYRWMERFNDKFFDGKLSTAVLSFEKTRCSTLGHYVTERNAIGVQDNINMNSVHLRREKWQILSTLLHEMVHQYQRRLGSFSDKEVVTSNNYHNKEFLTMTASFGLIYNKKGQRIDKPQEVFVNFLKEHGVEVTEEKAYDKPIGKSKLKKFSCQCTPPINVRVGNSEFSAKCNLCNKDFEEQ
ncbi:MAG: SprT-like domain-containing protein [Novosphingobium sp.]|nr:SprT-like domain-containing protein [Novosphingobium sp.]